MKKITVLTAIIGTLLCLSGCKADKEITTLQEEEIPVVVIEREDAEPATETCITEGTIIFAGIAAQNTTKATVTSGQKTTATTAAVQTNITAAQTNTAAGTTDVPQPERNPETTFIQSSVQNETSGMNITVREETTVFHETSQTEVTAPAGTTPSEENRSAPVIVAADENEPDTNAEPCPIFGDWYYEVRNAQNSARYDIEGYVTVNEDGSYFFQPRDGSLRKTGTVTIEEEANGNRCTQFYTFRESEENTNWIRTKCAQSNPEVFEINQGAARLYHREYEPLVEYVGMWQGWERDDLTLKVSDDGAGYIFEVRREDGPSAYSIWTFYCIGISDGTYMYCVGGGTLVQVSENGERTEVYNDATAQFRKRCGMIFWSDHKADPNDQPSIEKAFTRM